MQRYSLYAYDPGDHCLEISKEKDNKYGEWIKYKDVKEILDVLAQYLEECKTDYEDRWITRERLRELLIPHQTTL